MIKVNYYIDPSECSVETFQMILRDGKLIEGCAHNNYRHFDRSATDLLQDADVEDQFDEQNFCDDTAPFIEMEVAYPAASLLEIQQLVGKYGMDDDHYEIEDAIA